MDLRLNYHYARPAGVTSYLTDRATDTTYRVMSDEHDFVVSVARQLPDGDWVEVRHRNDRIALIKTARPHAVLATKRKES